MKIWAGATGLVLLSSAPLAAEEVRFPDPAGICLFRDIGGRAIVDEDGQLVSLVDFCAQQQAQQIQAPVLSADGAAFWRSFQTVASPEAIAFSQTLDPRGVVDYAATICPFLQNGGSLSQIRQIQAEGDLPVTFDVAVTVAAIDAYCPAFRSQIGR